MYAEDLGKLTADHLRTHIRGYLNEVDSRFAPSPEVPLVLPKTIEYASVVGGTMTAWSEILPQYGVDVLTIMPATDSSNLWTHEYDGQINGLVGATTRQMVDALCLRHANAVHLFIERHMIMHDDGNTSHKDDYRIVQFLAGNIEFSGAENLGMIEDVDVWIAGFSINVAWLLSQNGPDQHANP